MTIRLIHGSFCVGILLFAAVNYFLIRPARAGESLAPAVLGALLGLSLAASAFGALVLRRRVPRRNTDESADLYWTTAAAPALLTWAPLEGGALIGLVAYLLDGSPAGLAVAAVALAGLIALNPGRLERS
jgi:hypothetical protein